MRRRVKLWIARYMVRRLRARGLWIVTDADFAAAVHEGVQSAGERMIPEAVAEALRGLGLRATVDGTVVRVDAPATWKPPRVVRPIETPTIEA